MFKRPVLGRFAATVLMAVALLSASVQQARADIGSCISAYTGADFFKVVETFADPQLSQCATEIQVGPDVIMAAATAGMVALAFDHAFDNTSQCKALVKTTIGGFIAQLLLAAAPVKSVLQSLLPEAAFQALVDMASGKAVEALDAIPGLNVLLHKVDCGCQFAGAGLAAKDALEAYYKSVKGCGQFIADVGDALLGALESGADTAAEILVAAPKAVIETVQAAPEGAAKAFNGSNYGLTPGVQQEQTNEVIACAPGLNDSCDVCWGFPNPPAMVKVGGKLACKCPSNNQGYTTSNATGCQICPAGTLQMPNGQCGGCPKGQVFKGGSCVAACPTGQILGANGQCGGCPAGAHPSYAEFKFVQEGNYSVVAPVNSLGACLVCPSGSVFSESQNKCVAGCPAWQKADGGACTNRCGPNEKFIPGSNGGIVVNGGTVIPGQNTKATCTPCPSGTQLNSATNICVKGGGGSSPAPQPTCAAAEFWDGQACVAHCAPHLVYTAGIFQMGNNGTGKLVTPESCKPCAAGSQYSVKTNSCSACPAGAQWKPYGDGSGGSCACPSGSVQQFNTCVSTGPLGQPGGIGTSVGGRPPVLNGGAAPIGTSCPPGMIRGPQGVCAPPRMGPVQPAGAAPVTRAPQILQIAPGMMSRVVDCSTRGANFITSPQTPGGCAACPDGQVANPTRDVCVAATPRFIPQRIAPPPQVRRGQ